MAVGILYRHLGPATCDGMVEEAVHLFGLVVVGTVPLEIVVDAGPLGKLGAYLSVGGQAPEIVGTVAHETLLIEVAARYEPVDFFGASRQAYVVLCLWSVVAIEYVKPAGVGESCLVARPLAVDTFDHAVVFALCGIGVFAVAEFAHAFHSDVIEHVAAILVELCFVEESGPFK